MADQKLNTGDDGQYNKVINGICLKVLDKANFTNLNWYVKPLFALESLSLLSSYNFQRVNTSAARNLSGSWLA